MVHLLPEMIERLNERASAESVSRSQVIRQAVAAYLAAETDRREAESTKAAYRAQPPDAPDDWGDLGEWRQAARNARVDGRG